MIKYIPIINRFVVNECQLGDKIKSLKSHNIIPILDYAVETNLHSMNNILYPRYNTNDSFKENYKKILRQLKKKTDRMYCSNVCERAPACRKT